MMILRRNQTHHNALQAFADVIIAFFGELCKVERGIIDLQGFADSLKILREHERIEKERQREIAAESSITLQRGKEVKIKRYGDYIRLIGFLSGRIGFKDEEDLPVIRAEDLHEDDGSGLGRALSNVSRSKSRIRELALCNDWDYFATLTLSPEWGDRRDLPRWRENLSRWICYFRESGRAPDFAYLFVPEEHKAGGWHMHGLIKGLPREELRLFSLREKLPHYIRDKLREGQAVYDWPAYSARYGFIDLEPVRSSAAVCSYISKYVSKALGDLALAGNAHSFYASQGLAGAEEVIFGRLLEEWHFDFSNQFVAIADMPAEGWLDTLIGMISPVPGASLDDFSQLEADAEIIRYYAALGLKHAEN